MIVDEYIDIEVTKKNLRHIRIKFKNCNIGDIVKAHYLDFGTHSHKRIILKCDYCGEIFDKEIYVYCRKFKKQTCQNDSCQKCSRQKAKETCIIRFGKENFLQTDERKKWMSENNHLKTKEGYEKYRKKIKEKLGVDNVFQLQEIKDKIKETNLEKYGYEHLMKNEDVKINRNIKRIKTLYKNGNQMCSLQQKYLHNLLGGELNYPQDKFSLDIAFIKDKIYCEYCGGGHDLQVKLGKITFEEFKQKENIRYYILKNKGWKQIYINCPKDKLPNDNIILEEVNKAFLFLKEKDNYHYIINF